MRLHRFFVHTPIIDETFDISDRDMVHQWTHVFRYNVGSQVVLFDGTGFDFLCMISSLRPLGATVSVISKKKSPEIRRNIGIAFSLLKKDNNELIIQKATELGVSSLFPIISDRSEKKNINLARAKKIALEASEQSGRGNVPEIFPPTTLTKVLENEYFGTKIALHPYAVPFSEFEKRAHSDSVLVFIGPEGGYSEEEIKLFEEHNVNLYSLGPTILRGETAVITILSLLLLGK